MPRMRVQSVRFGHRDWERIKEAADKQGLSASQFIRNWARTGALLESSDESKTARQLARAFHEEERASEGDEEVVGSDVT